MITINGEEWRVAFVSPFHPALEKVDGTFSIGCCDDIKKTIYISHDLDDFYIRKVLCHELTHAAMFSYNVNLNYEQEELLADLIATYGQEIIDITNDVFKRIKEIWGT